jgi:hypothetical protein
MKDESVDRAQYELAFETYDWASRHLICRTLGVSASAGARSDQLGLGRIDSFWLYLVSCVNGDCVGPSQNSANFASMTSASAAQPISRIELGAG